jgi:putative FmdB family regulatory protein
MPIFEYQCKKCGHAFDVLQKTGEGALKKCPECGKLALDKLLSAPAFQVKGKEGATVTRKRVGHNLDGPTEHSHSHSHGGHTHSHGPGCGHKH